MIEEKLIGYVSVDTGQVIIIDPCYIEHFQNNAIVNKEPFPGHEHEYTKGYRAACEQTLSAEDAGQIFAPTKTETPGKFEIAVASNSGWGDGRYPVYATRNRDGRIVQLRILFIEGDEM